MKILWTRTAVKRLEEIHAYIEKDSPGNADKWLKKILSKAEALAQTPGIGRSLPELGSKSVREIIAGNYRIVYKIAKDSIFVLTVRHCKQVLPMADFIDLKDG